jgi:hypothetical protein
MKWRNWLGMNDSKASKMAAKAIRRRKLAMKMKMKQCQHQRNQ